MPSQSLTNSLTTLTLGACLFLMLSSCGGSGGSGQKKDQFQEIIDGKYMAELRPLNSAISGLPSGTAKITVEGDQISVKLEMKDTPASTVHSQYIYSASACPNEKDDLNDDGFVDPVEAAKVYGSILIPLDGDLNSQIEGLSQFPKADSLGKYHYEQNASFSKLLTDLQAVDPNEKDDIIKLKSNEELRLQDKVIIVHGVHSDAYIPGSVNSTGASSERITLPIACGKIIRAP